MDKEIAIVLSVAVLGIATLVTVPVGYMCRAKQHSLVQYELLCREVPLVHVDENTIMINEDRLELPSGFQPTGNFTWNFDGSRVAFYITNQNLDAKLAITECQTGEIILLDPPGGTKYNLDVLLLWSKDDVILSAGGKAYITKWN